MKSGTLLEQIYYGEFLPGERPLSREEEYRAVCKEVDESIRYFAGRLKGGDQRRFDQLIRAMQDMSGMDAYANFACGFRSGARLMLEMEEKPRSFSG